MGYYEHVDHSKNGFAIMYLDPKRKKISWRYDDDLPNGWVIIRTKRNENAYFVILDKLVAHVVSPVRVSDRLPGLNTSGCCNRKWIKTNQEFNRLRMGNFGNCSRDIHGKVKEYTAWGYDFSTAAMQQNFCVETRFTNFYLGDKVEGYYRPPGMLSSEWYGARVDKVRDPYNPVHPNK